MRWHAAILTFLFPFASACSTLTSPRPGPMETPLGSAKDASGTERRYRLQGWVGGPAQLIVSTRTETAEFGVDVGDVDRKFASERHVAPWQGVRVAAVRNGSAAARAGLAADDVITTVNDRPVAGRTMFAEFIERELPVHETARLSVVHCADPSVAPEKRTVVLTPDAAERDAGADEAIPLATLEPLEQCAGMQVVELPADAARAAFGDNAPAVAIAAVVPGGPAYRVGLRGGDRILKIDGAPIANLAAARAIVAERVEQLATGPAILALDVDGALGPHSASIPLVADTGAATSFSVPIAFEYQANAIRTEWKSLQFVFPLGPSFKSQFLDSPTRSPRTQSRRSLLPLRLLDIEHTPTEDCIRLFWLIHWRTAARAP